MGINREYERFRGSQQFTNIQKSKARYIRLDLLQISGWEQKILGTLEQE